MAKINLAVSTLDDSMSDMTEHLLSEYMEAAHEFKVWRGAKEPISYEALAMELVDVQFMAASIARLHEVIMAPIWHDSHSSPNKARARLYRAWVEMSDKLIYGWNYLRNVGETPTSSEERNAKAVCRRLVVAVEYVLDALDRDEDERNRFRGKVCEKNRMRGYYD